MKHEFITDAFRSQIAQANQRRRDRELAWLEAAADIIRGAHEDMAEDLDRYDERIARRASEATDAELDAMERARDMRSALL